MSSPRKASRKVFVRLRITQHVVKALCDSVRFGGQVGCVTPKDRGRFSGDTGPLIGMGSSNACR